MNKKLMALLVAVMMLVCCACGKKEEQAGEVTLGNFEAVDSFIQSIYGEFGQDELPMMLMQTELPLDDPDMLAYNTGLQSADGVASAVVSESATGSIAYSMIYIVTEEGADAEAIQSDILANIDPRKWVCVGAEKMVSFTMGNDVFFVMGGTDMVDRIVTVAEEKAAELGFTQLGEKQEKVG